MCLLYYIVSKCSHGKKKQKKTKSSYINTNLCVGSVKKKNRL